MYVYVTERKRDRDTGKEKPRDSHSSVFLSPPPPHLDISRLRGVGRKTDD